MPQATPDELTVPERSALRYFLDEHGESAAAQKIGCTRETLARALAGLGIRRGSVALIRAVLVNGKKDKKEGSR